MKENYVEKIEKRINFFKHTTIYNTSDKFYRTFLLSNINFEKQHQKSLFLPFENNWKIFTYQDTDLHEPKWYHH